jgi:hypothetical protein
MSLMDTIKSRFAVRVTRHSKSLWIVRIERWVGCEFSAVERRDTTCAKALSRARVEFKARTRTGK